MVGWEVSLDCVHRRDTNGVGMTSARYEGAAVGQEVTADELGTSPIRTQFAEGKRCSKSQSKFRNVEEKWDGKPSHLAARFTVPHPSEITSKIVV